MLDSAGPDTVSQGTLTSGVAHDPGRRGLPRWSPRVLMYHYFGAPPGPDPEKLFVDRPSSPPSSTTCAGRGGGR